MCAHGEWGGPVSNARPQNPGFGITFLRCLVIHYKCPQMCLPRTQAVGWCLEYTMINTVGSLHGGSALDPSPNQAHGALTTFWAQMAHFCLYQFCCLECLSLPSKHLLPLYTLGITAAMERLPNTQLQAHVRHLTLWVLFHLTGTALLLQVSQYLTCVLKPGWELVPLTASALQGLTPCPL